jgi:aubergine-like protein
LLSNYFPIKTYTNWTLYQYRVDFNPKEEKVMVRRGLLSNHKDFLGAYLFDGTMLISSKKYKPDLSLFNICKLLLIYIYD